MIEKSDSTSLALVAIAILGQPPGVARRVIAVVVSVGVVAA